MNILNIIERNECLEKCLNGTNIESLAEPYLPKSLFKYRAGISKNMNGVFVDIDALYQQYLWMPNAASLNDPYECLLFFQWKDECAEKFGFDKDLVTNSDIPKINSDLDDFAQSFREKFNIISFSEENSSLLMWSHYANEHKGFCIEYSTNEFKSFFFPVMYSNKIPNALENECTVPLSMITKSKDWQYELEWRIVNQYDGFISDGHQYPAPMPKAIYLGCRIDENNELKDNLISVSKEFGITLYQMKMKKGYYELETEMIYDYSK